MKIKKTVSRARRPAFNFPLLERLLGTIAVCFLAVSAAAQNSTSPKAATAGGDEFNAEKLESQWQWNANFQNGWAFMFPARGVLRMNSVQTPEKYKNLRDAPNLLLRRFPAEEFTATVKIMLQPRFEGEKFGLLAMGSDYAYIGVTYKAGKTYIAPAAAKDADKGAAEIEGVAYQLGEKTFYLRVKVAAGALCQFSFSTDGAKYTNLGVPVKAREERANGVKIGLFFTRPAKFNDAGTADVDWFRIE
jgi:beta-xylosidase